MPQYLAESHLVSKSSVVAAVLFLCISQAACTKKDAAHGHELQESMIIQSNCGENCNETHLLFYAEAVDDGESIVGAELSVSPSEASGFSYCLSYFNDRTCAESQLTWSRVMGGHLTFPCGDPNIGYLIEALRAGNVGGEAHDLPSIWLAYANGEVAAAEGETPEALLPMFVCSGE